MNLSRPRRSVRVVGCLLALAAAARSVIASAGEPAAVGVRVERDVPYLEAGRAETADLYLPSGGAPGERRPAVLIIHGGGWTGGDKHNAREINIGTNLAAHGYVALSINYALATSRHATWPQNVHDCKTAVRWLRKNADRFQIDTNHIGVIGGSAGGHLAALLAVTGPADHLDPAQPYGEFSCAVQCAVDFYGPADLAQHRDLAMLGKTRAQDPSIYRAASPVSYADRNDPPILIVHGTADKTVNVKQSELFAAALEAAGAPHQLVTVPGAGHSFDLEPRQRDLRPLVLGFFDRYLRGPAVQGEKVSR
jgi:acetyl esterase/lipase